jgi:hypothetical protein
MGRECVELFRDLFDVVVAVNLTPPAIGEAW